VQAAGDGDVDDACRVLRARHDWVHYTNCVTRASHVRATCCVEVLSSAAPVPG
jgi:hypothetical protein